MKVEHTDPDLERLEKDMKYSGRWSQAIRKAYRNRMGLIRQAEDERTFRSQRSLHFEQLRGRRAHQHSIRLNRQFRLILELIGKAPNKVVRIIAIEDYH